MNVPVRISILVVAIGSGAVCGLWSTFLLQKIVGLVNQRLPAEQKFAPFWWHAGKQWRLLREYRRLYPEAVLLRQLGRVVMGAVASLALGMIAIGFGWEAALLFGVAAGTLQWFFHRPRAAEPPRAPGAGRAS